MALTLLHTSDWHIGKPFGRFDDNRAVLLRHARLAAIDRLATLARSRGARIALVAGDLFDRPTLSDRDVREPIEQLRAHGDIAWHVIPGNHDPAMTGGVWERVLRTGLPSNVTLHLDARPIDIGGGCFLLPAPLTAKALSTDPTAWMDDAATPEGALRIGLAHGSVQGFGSETSASIMIAPDRPRRASLDYLALGDWHGTLKLGPRAAYSGTPEPDGFLDNDAGGALIVTIEGAGAPPRIDRQSTGQYRWVERRLQAMRSTDLVTLEQEIDGWGAAQRETLLSVRLSGRIGLAEREALRQRLGHIDPRLFILETNEDELRIAALDTDLESLGDGVVAAVARGLAVEAEAVGTPEAAAAERALRHLFELASTDAGAAGRGRS